MPRSSALDAPHPDGDRRARSRSSHPMTRGSRRLSVGLMGTAAGAILLAACGSGATVATKKKVVPVAAPKVAPVVATCPLTGTPAPGGQVPQHPALGVKVDNYVAARPQTGLDQADIIYEEPVEGGITRYAAVFQCQQPTTVGPVRSARNIDIGILGQFGQPLIAHVGGIDPVLANIEASPLVNVDLGNNGSIIQNPPGRVPPYDDYTSTAAVWGLRPKDTAPPAPVFAYSKSVPAGTPAGAVAVPFSSNSNVVWKYNAALQQYQRFYGTAPDTLADGAQNSATNVVVQFINVFYGPYVENSEGGLEVQANLDQNASGPAQIYRNGVEVQGSWSRSSLAQPTQYTTSAGAPIALAPGRTWVELVPNTVTVTATP